MLCITRKPRQEIILYTDDGLLVTIVVLHVHGDQVQIGLGAPKNVHIDRKELYDRKQAEIQMERNPA